MAGNTPVLVHNCNTTVYRYQEHPDSMRLSVNEAGDVALAGEGRLYVNMSGNMAHSTEFRGSGGHIVAFDMPTAYVNEILGNALPQRMPRGFLGSIRDWKLLRKNRPEISDPKKSPGLIGIPDSMLGDFMNNIAPGSGRLL